MKSIAKILMTAAAVFAVVSCEKESRPTQQTEEPGTEVVPADELVSVTISAKAETSDGTKSYMSGKQVFWEENDAIAVFTTAGSTSYPLTADSYDTASATFSGSLPVGGGGSSDLWAVYPATAAVSLETGGILTASIPAEQQVGDNNTSKGALLSVGKGSVSAGLTMKNVFGLVKVTITRSDVAAVTLDGTALAGTVKVNASTGVVSETVSASGSVTLTPKEGESTFATGDYYIAVLPGTTDAGSFSVTLATTGGKIEGVPYGGTYTLTDAVKVPRNGGFFFSDAASSLSYGYHIYNKTQLLAWNSDNGVNKLTSADNTHLWVDIDLDGVEWAPMPLKGTFDGHNHKLYNIVAEPTDVHAGLFRSAANGSTLKNLVVGSSDGENYDGTSRFTYSFETNSSYGYAGVIAYVGTGAKAIENVTNFAKVSSPASSTHRIRLGGIVGGCQSQTNPVQITSCINRGEVIVEATGTLDANSRIGGIVGYSDGPMALTDCTNYGSITTANNKVNGIGGIIGGFADVAFTLDNCDNEGAVSFNGYARSTEMYVGGIAAIISSASAEIQNCDNKAAVTFGPNNTTPTSSQVATKRINVGGIAGAVTATCPTFATNKNSGEITVRQINTQNQTDTTAVEDLFANHIGGIIGRLSAPITVSDCHNLSSGTVHDTFSALNTTKTSYIKIGGIVGMVEAAATITGCTNSGLIEKTGTAFVRANIGGIVGVNCIEAATITGCNNYGSVSTDQSSQATTSLKVYNNMTDKKSVNLTAANHIGGIIGYTIVATDISNCNVSDVTIGVISSTATTTYNYCGGIVGRIDGNATVSGCTASATVKNDGNNTTTNGIRYGGIVGQLGGTSSISGCTFTGTVSNTYSTTAAHFLGGLIGLFNGTKATVEDNIANGNVNTSGTNGSMGIIAGRIANATINHNGVAGTVGGITLDIDNFEDYLYKTTSTPKITTTTANYYYNSSALSSIAPLGVSNDNTAW